VRARLGAAQADLAAEKVKAMRGETLPTAEVGGVPVKLASELRATLTELAMMPQHRQCAR
jgi:phage terminase Nu1 subunit (DNA packaging protein)